MYLVVVTGNLGIVTSFGFVVIIWAGGVVVVRELVVITGVEVF